MQKIRPKLAPNIKSKTFIFSPFKPFFRPLNMRVKNIKQHVKIKPITIIKGENKFIFILKY